MVRGGVLEELVEEGHLAAGPPVPRVVAPHWKQNESLEIGRWDDDTRRVSKMCPLGKMWHLSEQRSVACAGKFCSVGRNDFLRVSDAIQRVGEVMKTRQSEKKCGVENVDEYRAGLK